MPEREAPAPARWRPLWGAGWTLGAVGAAAAIGGAILVGLDGQPTCDLPMPETTCPNVRDSWRLGTAGLVVGGAVLVTGAIMIGVAAKRRGREQSALTSRPQRLSLLPTPSLVSAR